MMLTHPTHGRLMTLGLIGMAKALDEQQRQPDIATLAFEERLALLVDREATERENKRLVSRLRFASLRQNAVVEDIDVKAPAGSTRRCSKSSSPASGSNDTRTCSSSAPPASARVGLPARSATRPVGITDPSSISACRASSMRSRWPAATAITRASSRAWRASNF
jgi:hypothetical protein